MEGDLIWELRRLLAWSGGTIADVTQTLELRGIELDAPARALLQEEVEALVSDLALLTAVLNHQLDWDRAYERLLAGEIPPLGDAEAEDEEEEDEVVTPELDEVIDDPVLAADDDEDAEAAPAVSEDLGEFTDEEEVEDDADVPFLEDEDDDEFDETEIEGLRDEGDVDDR